MENNDKIKITGNSTVYKMYENKLGSVEYKAIIDEPHMYIASTGDKLNGVIQANEIMSQESHDVKVVDINTSVCTLINRNTYVRVNTLAEITDITKFYVDKVASKIYFHKDMIGRSVKIGYSSMGLKLIGANNIFVEYTDSDVTRTLQQLLDQINAALAAIKIAGGVIEITDRLEINSKSASEMIPVLLEALASLPTLISQAQNIATTFKLMNMPMPTPEQLATMGDCICKIEGKHRVVEGGKIYNLIPNVKSLEVVD